MLLSVERRSHHASSSRAWLTAAGIAALTALGAAAWHARSVPEADEAAFSQRGIEVRRLTVDSEALQRSMRVVGLVPKGAINRPILVFLHGRGDNEESLLNRDFADALASFGDEAPIVIVPHGGDSSYWHNRRDGDWGDYVLNDVIPLGVTALGGDRNRVAIAGVSMGGFGAYDLTRQKPSRFCATAGSSPAIWSTEGEAAAGAFDDSADFERHNIVRAAKESPLSFTGPKLWLDSGSQDPFRPGQRDFLSALRSNGVAVVSRESPGGHDETYWRAHYRDTIALVVEGCGAGALSAPGS